MFERLPLSIKAASCSAALEHRQECPHIHSCFIYRTEATWLQTCSLESPSLLRGVASTEDTRCEIQIERGTYIKTLKAVSVLCSPQRKTARCVIVCMCVDRPL